MKWLQAIIRFRHAVGREGEISAEVARQTIVNVRGRNGGVPCSHRNLMQVRYDISDGV